MSLSKITAGRVLAVFVALTVVLGTVTVGGVAQTNSGNDDASGEDVEPNDSLTNATQIEYGEEVNASLSSPDDVDYYAVNATAGDAVLPRLHLKDVFEGSAIQVDVVAPTGEVTTELTNDLMSGPQNSVGAASTLSGSDMAYTGDVMESNGTYYVRVKEATNLPSGGPETDASDTYQYSLTVNRTAVDEHDPNENGSTATPVTAGETLTATFAGYDSDVYALNVTAGESYTVSIAHPNDVWPDYATKVLYVYANRSQAADDPAWQYAEDGKSPYYREPNGSTVATSATIHDGPVSTEFTAETNGTYYHQLVQDPQNYNLLARDEYELTVNRTGEVPSDGGETSASPDDAGTEPNDSPANATHVEYGETVNATLSSPDDVDYYAVNATAGDGLVSRLQLRDLFEGSAVAVDVLDSGGRVSTESRADLIVGPPTVAGESRPLGPRDTAAAGDVMESNGTYYVRVREADQFAQTNTSDTYRYGLAVTRQDLDRFDPNENGTTATPITPGEPLSAVVAGYDTDTYALHVTAGRRYTVSVDADDAGDTEKLLFVAANASVAIDDPDPYTRAAGSPGVVAKVQVDLPSNNTTFVAQTDGTYYVQIGQSALNTRLASTDDYTVSVEENDRETDTDTDADADGDGLSDSEERQLGTDPNATDSDSDGLTDPREVDLGTDPLSADTDGDGLTDDCELINEMDATDPDTDDDGTLDGDEV